MSTLDKNIKKDRILIRRKNRKKKFKIRAKLKVTKTDGTIKPSDIKTQEPSKIYSSKIDSLSKQLPKKKIRVKFLDKI